MFSHGATMPGVVEGPLSMPWHAARFAAQVSVRVEMAPTLPDSPEALGWPRRSEEAPSQLGHLGATTGSE